MRLQHLLFGFILCCYTTFTVFATNQSLVINQHNITLRPLLTKDSLLSRSLYLFQFNHALDDIQKASFIERGIQIEEQLSDRLFLVYISQSLIVDPNWNSFALQAVPYSAQLKTTHDLFVSTNKQNEKLLIKFVSAINPTSIQSTLLNIGATAIQFLSTNLLSCSLPNSMALAIIAKLAVPWVTSKMVSIIDSIKPLMP